MIKKLFKISASLFVIRTAISLTKYVALIINLHKLPFDSYSYVLYLLSWAEVVRAVIDFGSEGYCISKTNLKNINEEKIVVGLLNLRLFLSILLTSLMIILYIDKYVSIEVLFISFIISSSLIQTVGMFFIIRDNPSRLAYVGPISVILIIIIAIFINLFDVSSLTFGCSLILADVVVGIVMIVVGLSCTNPSSPIIQLNPIRFFRYISYVKYIVPLGINTVLVVLYNRSDVLLVRPVFGNELQGEFSLLVRLIDPLSGILSIVSYAFLVEIGSKTVDEVKMISFQFSKKNMIFILFSWSVSSIIVSVVLVFKLGLKFNEIELYLYSSFFGCLIIPFRFVNSMIGSVLIKRGRINVIMYAAIITFFATYILELLGGWYVGLLGLFLGIILAEIGNTIYLKYAIDTDD